MLNNFYVLSPCLALFWPSLIFILRDHIIYRVYSVTSPGESYDSVEDQCQGRASSAVHLVEGWSVFHFYFLKISRACQLFHFHFLKISRALSVVPLSLSQDIQSFVSCSTFTFSSYPELRQLFTFTFSRYPHCRFAGRKIETSDEYQVETQEYQGGATAILQILKTQVNSLSFSRLFGMEL